MSSNLSASAVRTGWPAGIGRVVLDEVDSTNAEATRLAAAGAGPTWILARRQMAGRGRRGRAWRDPAGNFAATLLLRPPEPPARAALRSFVAALALSDTLTDLTGRAAGLSLKWPNDVLLNGGKVAGILLESAGSGPKLDFLGIGIGVNLAQAPSEDSLDRGASRPVSILSETGARIAPETMLDALAERYAARETQFTRDGFRSIRDDWLTQAARRGQSITARTGERVVEGRFDDIDADGALVLATATGRVIVPAAEIYF